MSVRADGGERPRVGLVLAGGGARGAYEVGALSVLLPALEDRGERPTVYVGTSVGAINAASLAASLHLPARDALEEQLGRWHELHRGSVIRSVLARLPLTLLRYAGQTLSLPGARLLSLLDPAPLERNLARWIDWDRLHLNVAGEPRKRIAVIATAARTGRAVAFVEGCPREPIAPSHVIEYMPANLDASHIRASAAIPLLFPPVHVEQPPQARGWYVDGATRLNTPVKPALDLGAERLVVIATGSLVPPPRDGEGDDAPAPDLGSSAVHLLQGALTDPLVEDMRTLAEVNRFHAEPQRSPAVARRRAARGKPPYRLIPYMFIAPRSHDAIARLASDVFASRYGSLRALRSPDLAALGRLLGTDGYAHGELLSYLLFDADFIHELIAMGARDARAWLRADHGVERYWRVGPLGAKQEKRSPAGIAAAV